MAGGVVPLRDKSTGFSGWVTGTPKRAQDRLLAGAALGITPGGCFVYEGMFSKVRLGRLFSGKPLIVAEATSVQTENGSLRAKGGKSGTQ